MEDNEHLFQYHLINLIKEAQENKDMPLSTILSALTSTLTFLMTDLDDDLVEKLCKRLPICVKIARENLKSDKLSPDDIFEMRDAVQGNNERLEK